MPGMAAKAAERPHTAFLWRGYIRYRVKRKIASTCLKMRNRGYPNFALVFTELDTDEKPALFAILAASGAL